MTHNHDEERFRRFLKRHDRRRAEAHAHILVLAELVCDLPHQAAERGPADEQLRGLLVFADLTAANATAEKRDGQVRIKGLC